MEYKIQEVHYLTGELINEYDSIEEANADNGRSKDHSAIKESIDGTLTSGDSHWRTSNDKDPYLYVGIDVGKSGGVSIIDTKYKRVYLLVMPMISKVYDIRRLSLYLESHKDLIVHLMIEDVHAFHSAGSSASFEFGFGKGMLEGIVSALGIPYTRVGPKKWQEDCWSGTSKIIKLGKVNVKTGKKVKKTDTKATSEVAAKKLFPDLDLRDPERKTNRTKKNHDGIIDALLIAEHCRRRFR